MKILGLFLWVLFFKLIFQGKPTQSWSPVQIGNRTGQANNFENNGNIIFGQNSFLNLTGQ